MTLKMTHRVSVTLKMTHRVSVTLKMTHRVSVTLKMTHRVIVVEVFLSGHRGTHERKYGYFYLGSFVFLRGF